MTNSITFTVLEGHNFMSFGEKGFHVRLDTPGLTMILGENDDSPDADARNGVGKSTLLDAFAFVFTGKPIRKLRVGKLVNKVNKKHMWLAGEAVSGTDHYRVVRGQNPTFLKFYKKPLGDPRDWDAEELDAEGRKKKVFDRTRDSVANTQEEIFRVFRIDNDLLKYAIVNSTRVLNFFEADSSVQKHVVECLFGFQLLSAKAEVMKETRRDLELRLGREEERIKVTEAYNEKLKQRVEDLRFKTIEWDEDHQRKTDDLRVKSDQWDKQHAERLKTRRDDLKELQSVDLEAEEKLLAKVRELREEKKYLADRIVELDRDIKHLGQQRENVSGEMEKLRERLEVLKSVDAEEVVSVFDKHQKANARIQELISEKSRQKKTMDALTLEIHALELELGELAHQDTCPTCGQQWPDQEARDRQKNALKQKLEKLQTQKDDAQNSMEALLTEMGQIQESMPDLSGLPFKTRDEAVSTRTQIESLEEQLAKLEEQLKQLVKDGVDHQNAVFEVDDQLLRVSEQIERLQKKCTFEDVSELAVVKNELKNLGAEIARLEAETNPHAAHLEMLEKTENPYRPQLEEAEGEAAKPIDYSTLNSLNKEITHLKFLEQLLTKKDSPIRRKVTARWLPELNRFMAQYLQDLDMPYSVEFQDDLSPLIHNYGEEIEIGNLSGGETERLNLALSWAFGDVFERINFEINFRAVDERLESGLCESGKKRAIEILRQQSMRKNKTVWLISHEKGLTDYADRIMTIRKSGGFSEVSDVH